MSSVQATFLSAPKYAVVGASKDQTKFGTKVSSFRISIRTRMRTIADTTTFEQVLKWYQARSKDVTPVHPVRP